MCTSPPLRLVGPARCGMEYQVQTTDMDGVQAKFIGENPGLMKRQLSMVIKGRGDGKMDRKLAKNVIPTKA